MNSTTIIGILEMLEDGYGYRDIQARFSIGNSSITRTKRKFSSMNIPLKELAQMDSKEIHELFYPSPRRKEIPLPDFKSVYDLISNKKNKMNLYFVWLDYKKIHPDGYQYTQFKKYFKDWLTDHHLIQNVSMPVERIPGEIVYIDWIGDTLDLVLDSNTGELLTNAIKLGH